MHQVINAYCWYAEYLIPILRKNLGRYFAWKNIDIRAQPGSSRAALTISWRGLFAEEVSDLKRPRAVLGAAHHLSSNRASTKTSGHARWLRHIDDRWW